MGAKKVFEVNTSEAILNQAYRKFELNFFGKKVWVPYRINIPFQSDRRRYGKWSAKKIKTDTQKIAKEVGFDIEKASSDEIREFMKTEMIGIDCSGYAYQLLDVLLKKTNKGSMVDIGFPKASSTNVSLLTDEKFAQKVEDKVINIKPGDMIRFGPNKNGQWHVLVVMKNDNKKIVYSHSSGYSLENGVSKETIEVIDPNKSLAFQNWLGVMSSGVNRGNLYVTEKGSVYRLKGL